MGFFEIKAYNPMVSGVDLYIYAGIMRRDMQTSHTCELTWLVIIAEEADSHEVLYLASFGENVL